MMHEQKITESIMTRVWAVYVLRQLAIPLCVEVGATAAAVIGIYAFVSLGDVFANVKMMIAAGSGFTYLWSAITHTEMALQALLLIGCLAAVYFFWSAVRVCKPFIQRSFVRA